MRYIFLTFTFLISSLSYGQVSLVKRALKAKEKRDLEKCESLLIKANEKIPGLPGVSYAWSALKFDSSYSKNNLDSSYTYLLAARRGFTDLDEKEMSKHVKIGIDLLAIDKLKKKIEKAAFDRAINKNQEQGYIYFLDFFTNTRYQKSAIKKRDSLAYQEAVAQNSYQAYQQFMNKYPNALQYKEATNRYEKLYYYKSTADGKLNSYKKFLRIHPSTPYRKEAEKQIFEISTASNLSIDFQRFINQYPNSIWSKKAQRILYHLNQQLPPDASDSLQQVAHLKDKGGLIPIYQSGLYGFIDANGQSVIKPKHNTILKESLCNILEQEFYVADNKVYAKNGVVIYDQYFKHVTDIGKGILQIQVNTGVKIWHKSGWPITDKIVDEIKLLGNQFIGYKFRNKWGLMTFTGRELIQPIYDDIISEGSFFLLRNDDYFDVANSKTIQALVNSNTVNFQPLYDDFQLLNKDHIWLQTDYGETVFDEELNEVVPYNQQEIIELNEGYLIVRTDNVSLLDNDFKKTLLIDGHLVRRNEAYLVMQSESNFKLVSLHSNAELEQADSIELIGLHFAQVYRNDSSWVFFKEDVKMSVEQGVKLNLLASTETAQYLSHYHTDNDAMTYLNDRGVAILKEQYDELIPVGDEYLVFETKNKKGLLNSSGYELLTPKYDAIANYENGYISSLLDRKFGIINAKLGVQINNDFEQKIERYNDSIYIAKQNGAFGLVDKLGKKISSFDFDQILFWNDTLAIISQDFMYYFYDISRASILGDGYKVLKFIKDGVEEKRVQVLGPEGYGIFSNVSGEIIAPIYNDIVVLAGLQNDVYFTEKHVEEAEFYVVLYYNHGGDIIYKSAYEEDDYLLIYCEQ